MIPLQLTLSGIYSYRREQTIDFRALSAGHLFGIFGPVGSGKSAILEAMIYALYGEAERLNNRVSYNMMNLSSNELYIRFDFIAAGEEGTYRVVVRNKRSKSRFEDVKPQRSLYRVEGEELIPVEIRYMDRIIGINYENFRRTIIIPQGKFQEFLQLTPSARSEMLKDLFSLQKYDLSFKTGRLQRKNEEALNTCLGRIQQLGEVSEEQINTRQQDQKNLEAELALLRQQLSALTLKSAEMQKTESLFKELSKYRETHEGLGKQQDHFTQLQQQLSDFEDCSDRFKAGINLLNDRNKQLAEYTKTLQQKQAELTLAQKQLPEAESRFSHAREAYEQREAIHRQAVETELCSRANTLFKSAGELSIRIEKGKESVSNARNLITQLKTTLGELNDKTALLKKQLPDIQELQKAKDWHSEQNALQDKLTVLKQQSGSITLEMNALSEKCFQVAHLHHIVKTDIDNKLTLLPPLLDQQAGEAGKSLAETQDLLLHLEVQDRLRSYASGLEEGKPCPLCGSLEHPGILTIENMDESLRTLREKKSQLQSGLDTLKSSIIKINGFLEQAGRKQAELEHTGKLILEAEQILADQKNKNPSPDLGLEKLSLEWDNFIRLQKEIEGLDREFKKITLEADTAADNERKYAALLENLVSEQKSATSNAELLVSQLQQLDYKEYAGIPANVLKEEAEKLNKRYMAVSEEFKQAEKLYQSVSSEVQRLSASVSTLAQSLEILEHSTKELEGQLNEQIGSTTYLTLENVRKILARDIDRQGLRKEIQDYRQSLASAAASVSQLEKQLEGKAYDATEHQQLRSTLEEMGIQLDTKNQQKGAIEKEIQNLIKALADFLRLKEELRKLEARRENIRTLLELFRGQGFVNYVSTIYLQNLVKSANERFYKLTRQQLKLELDEENNFRVRDYLNSGEWRSVKTLSGGQTFQASLCLALALADSLQQLNQKGQNFFFLDEGFGSLDRDSLEMVFETLKSLRKENRIVGIISHVEDMQQEITSWLRIRRDEDLGSQIETSYSPSLISPPVTA